MTAKRKKTLSFEEGLSELETLVEALEQGDLNLEESLTSFSRGVELTRDCRHALKEAEQKVQILTDGGLSAEP
ncbi:MAG: exodeoxyribonuclease VII small subunit, partial [Sedimenticola sp.]